MKQTQTHTVTFMPVKAVSFSCSSGIPLGVCMTNEREELKESGITTLFLPPSLFCCSHMSL